MGFRICMMSILVTAFTSAFAAAPQSHSQLQPSLPALAVQAPPVAQPPRVPGEPPRSPVPQLPTGSRPESPRNDQITVTGCVEQSGGQASTKEPAAATGTSGKAAGTSKMSKYILTNPKLLGAVTGSPGQTSSSSSASGGLYQLDARDGKLSPHVGHQVEVIGSLKGGFTSSSSGQDAPKLKVEDIKMISASCGSPSSASPPEAR